MNTTINPLLYLIAHAPSPAPAWFKPAMPPKPMLPSSDELSEADQQGWRDEVLDFAPEEASPALRDFAERLDAARAAVTAWKKERQRQRQIQWPAYWARQVLKSAPEATRPEITVGGIDTSAIALLAEARAYTGETSRIREVPLPTSLPRDIPAPASPYMGFDLAPGPDQSAAFIAYDQIPSGCAGILAERARQVLGEGWGAEHDDKYTADQLIGAAMSYLHANWHTATKGPPPMWPWDSQWWKPKGRRRDLERAGALIAAELARMDRAAGAKA